MSGRSRVQMGQIILEIRDKGVWVDYIDHLCFKAANVLIECCSDAEEY